MRTASVMERATALSLCLVLISCSSTSSTRYPVSGPTGPLDLSRYVLVFETTPDGQETHAWKPLKDFNLAKYQGQIRAANTGRLVRTSLSGSQIGDICYEVWELCDQECRANPIPPSESHYISSFGGNEKLALDKYCEYKCRREESECREKLKRQAQGGHVFDSIDDALDWLKRHKAELAVGGVIVIAGVVFVALVCGGGGCLLLAPVLLFASADVPIEPSVAEACR